MRVFAVLALIAGFVTASQAAQSCLNQQCSPRVAEADIVFLIDTSSTLGTDFFVNIQSFLYSVAADLNIGGGLDQSRLAFITYSQDATTYGGLDKGADAAAVNATIGSLKYDGFALRELAKALTAEETVIASLRPSAKKLLVAIITDTFTGTEPAANGLLDKVRGKYDALLSVAVGTQAVQFAYTDVTTFSGSNQDTFLITGADQFDFARLWVERNACPQYHATTPSIPTSAPVTQPSGVTCTLTNLAYDIYLVVDTSSSMAAADFAAMKQSVINFVSQYKINDGTTQFGLITVSVDPQRYYTGFHAGQNSNTLTTALKLLVQEPSNGQAFDLALKVIDAAFLSTYASDSKTQLVVYFTGNTNFDIDPTSDVATLKTKYNLKFATVQYTSAADAGKLQKISGGATCSIDATDATKRGALGATLENLTCSKTFC